MQKSGFLALALAAMTGAGFGGSVTALPRSTGPAPVARRGSIRGRHPGEPGRAGDKLARMAAEGRLTLRGGPRQ